MPDQIQLRGGTAADNDGFTGVTREVTVDTTNKTLRVHDGVTSGGHPLIQGTASSAADADTIALRDAWGRLQVADPQDDQDAANKVYVDAAIGDSAPVSDRKQRTAGSVTVSSSDWQNIDTATDIVLPAKPGDFIIAGASGYWASEANTKFFDVVSWVSGEPVRSWSSDAATPDVGGVVAWGGISGVATRFGGTVGRQVIADEIVDGFITLRWRGSRLSAGNATLIADGANNFVCFAANLRGSA